MTDSNIPIGPRAEVVVWRDPDEGTDVAVFIDGIRLDNPEITIIDPGRGHDRDDWEETAQCEIEASSPACAELLTDWYAQAGNSSHITPQLCGAELSDGATCTNLEGPGHSGPCDR